MKNVLPLWGPYSKKYFGISNIVKHQSEEGVRFDFVVLPAVTNTDCKAPNVTIPVGVHPWECKADYSYYSYRQEMDAKSEISADVSFTRLSENATLVRTEIFNNSPLMQNCLVNYFSGMQYPFSKTVTLTLPEKCEFKKANNYTLFEYNTPRPWDRQTMDAMHKGEFFDYRFYEHRGLGDRDNNRYILPKFSKLGEEGNDRILYEFDIKNTYSNAVLAVRYRTTSAKTSSFAINGKAFEFKACDGLEIAKIPLGAINSDKFALELVSLGTGGIEFDFFAVCEDKDFAKIQAETLKNNYVPEVETEAVSDGALVKLVYDGVDKPYYVRTFNPDTRFREIPTGCLEDVPSPRLSQPDPSFDNMLETFSGEFEYKHSDEGYYQNTLAHTLFIDSGESHIEYAVISFGECEYRTTSEYEKLYKAAKENCEKFELKSEGREYEYSNELLRTAMFQNTVYPLYHHGEYVVHHTPGKRWDSFYTWDSGFIGLDMNMFCPEVAEYILNLYLSDNDNPDYAFLLHGSPVPVHIYQYFDMLCRENDKQKYYKYYDRARLFYLFLAGKINGSTTGKFKSGLTTTYDYFYNSSGMDDLPPQAEIYKRKIQSSAAPCISSSQVIRCAKLLKFIATELGRTDDIAEYNSDIQRLSYALDKYAWDEESGYYSYVIHNENGEPCEQLKTESGENLNKTMDGIYPLIAGITDKNKTEKILAHLKSEKEMMSKVGISAVNMTASYYADNGYWNGNVWFSHQWFVWKTMLDLGESDFAFKIAKTALEAWKKEVDYSGYTFEMISIKTGRGGWFHNFGGLSAPINLWAAAYFKAGNLNAGFDCYVKHQKFYNDFTSMKASLINNSKTDSIVIASMKDNCSYTVLLNGKEADYTERVSGTLEIVIPAGTKEAEIEVQLV